MSFQSTNNMGEIIVSPKFLHHDRNFYIFYCDVENSTSETLEEFRLKELQMMKFLGVVMELEKLVNAMSIFHQTMVKILALYNVYSFSKGR